jgi:hypothetical protein
LIISYVQLIRKDDTRPPDFMKKAIIYCLENDIDVKFELNGRMYFITPTSIVYTMLATQKEPARNSHGI